MVVEDNYSLIETINNRQVKISAKNIRTGTDGILVWSGDKYFFMQNIPKSFDVKVGDELITSNYSRKYPPQVPIGKVVKVEDDKSTLVSQDLCRALCIIFNIRASVRNSSK